MLGVALLVVFLVVQACMAASARSDREGDPSATSSSSPSAPPPSTTATTAPPSQSPDEELVGHSDGTPEHPANGSDGSCTDADIAVVAVADAEQVVVGGTLRVEIQIRNDSDRTCRQDIGGSQRELFIREGSGAGKVWSSRDCNADLTGSDVRDLPPAFETAHWAPWNTRRSDDCTETGEAAGALVEPGQYELVARLGTLYSEPVPITVTG